MHVHDQVPVRDRHLKEQVVTDDACVIDHHDRRAQFVGGPGNRGLDGILIRDVGGDADGPVAGCGQPGGEGFKPVLVEVDRCNVESIGRQAPGNFGADAASCSGDQRRALLFSHDET